MDNWSWIIGHGNIQMGTPPERWKVYIVYIICEYGYAYAYSWSYLQGAGRPIFLYKLAKSAAL